MSDNLIIHYLNQICRTANFWQIGKFQNWWCWKFY